VTVRCPLADFLAEGGPRRVPFQLCCVIGLVERDGDRLGCAAGLGLETRMALEVSGAFEVPDALEDEAVGPGVAP
jgi:hypothetical protein